MEQFNRLKPFALAILAGLILQIILVFADCKDSPSRAVIDFSKAYFMLNPKMADRLCEERRTMDDVKVVDYYLDRLATTAKKRGFGLDYMKNRLYHVKTETLQMDDTTAQVRLTGTRRFAMNPLYAVVGQIFGFTKSHPVDEVLTLVKESDRWKICGNPFRLPDKI